MSRATFANILWLLVIVCGCQTAPLSGEPDPLVEALVADGQTHLGTPLNTAAVLREIELGTPLARARATMERHGFSCWNAVLDSKGNCLYCTAYKRTPHAYKLVVKLFYDPQQKEVTDVEALVDYDVWRVLRPS